MEQFLFKMHNVIPVAVAIVLGIGLAILAWFGYRGWVEEFKTIAKDLNGEVAGGLFSRYVKLINQDREQRVKLVMGGKNTPPILVLSQPGAPDFHLFIGREDSGSRALEKIGLLHDLKTGDEKFDQKCLVRSKDRERALAFLASDQRRTIILDWINNGYESLVMEDCLATIDKPGYSEHELEAGPLKARLDQLLQLLAGAV